MSTERRTANLVLGAAVLTLGLLAGFFYAYTISVMPALADTDDRTYVDAMQQMIKVINESPLFFLTLLGAPALMIWALIIEWRAGSRLAVRWIAAALVLYSICFLLTVAVHVPLNDDLERAGNPAGIADLARVVDDFEGPWVAWDLVRTVALVGSFAALVGAVLVQPAGARQRTHLLDRSPESASVDVPSEGRPAAALHDAVTEES
ncbi:MAG: DUF1772 domain-containing protein [Dehalococcoidia bacterium]